MKRILFITILLACMTMQANADFISVSEIGPSSAGASAAIIAPPADALDDIVFNTGMEGFKEAQGVVTTLAHGIDGGGSIPIGTLVDSHMIFLNSSGSTFLSHTGVTWTFDRAILGVMSDSGGNLEAASTFELGNPATNYTAIFGGSGPAAPFPARGLEGIGNPFSVDGYLVAGNTITVGMRVSEPGDWIRVVTSGPVVPVPGAFLLGSMGLGFAAWQLKRRKRA